MRMQPGASRKPLARVEQGAAGRGQLWAIVLARGEGVRLRPQPTEVEYGWIELGRPLDPESPRGRLGDPPLLGEAVGGRGAGLPGKPAASGTPSSSSARRASCSGAGRKGLPEVADRPVLCTEDEGWAIQQAYALMPEADFSRAILAPVPACLAVSRLPSVMWSDLGSPRRVLQIVARLGMAPAWAREAVQGRS